MERIVFSTLAFYLYEECVCFMFESFTAMELYSKCYKYLPFVLGIIFN